jgi:hypothetical protein
MRRSLGRFRGRLVTSLRYLELRGPPQAPSDLEHTTAFGNAPR